MKWLVDAQLPKRLSERLNLLGHDSVHTLELVRGNRSTDSEIAALADENDRIVVSKDRDFLDSHIVNGVPRKLLWVTLGNISNNDLLDLIEQNLMQLAVAFGESDCIELTLTGIRIYK
jgi:predicted nuclease of predicted toxin-antitoxin system